jgi:hypothetical protein
LTIDEDGITLGAAKGGIFGRDFDSFFGFEFFESPQGSGINNL